MRLNYALFLVCIPVRQWERKLPLYSIAFLNSEAACLVKSSAKGHNLKDYIVHETSLNSIFKTFERGTLSLSGLYKLGISATRLVAN